jgi:hypothetical protein
VHAGVRQRRGIDAGGPGDARDIARQRRFDGRQCGGRPRAANGGQLRRDRGIERPRRIGERRFEGLGRQRPGVRRGVGQGSGRRSVTAQGRDAGKLDQGAGDGVGGGEAVPKNQTISGRGRARRLRWATS